MHHRRGAGPAVTAELDTNGLHVGEAGTIRTFTRRRVNPLALQPDDIDILDIGHALARQCRYNGHCEGFLSVARHSLWVSDALESDCYGPTIQLWGLLHDAAEAYLGDIVRPLKHTPDLALFRRAEQKAEFVIAKAFNLPWPMPPEVIEADRWVLRERELDGPRFRDTWDSHPAQDEAAFIHRYYGLVSA